MSYIETDRHMHTCMLDYLIYSLLCLYNITIFLLYPLLFTIDCYHIHLWYNTIDPKILTIYISPESRKKIHSVNSHIVEVQPT